MLGLGRRAFAGPSSSLPPGSSTGVLAARVLHLWGGGARSVAKRPSFQFYPGDWLRDTALRTCSVAARGLWIEMICLMHEGQPYGHLKVGDKVIDAPTLARMVGSNTRTIQSLLCELLHANVCEKLSDHTIISRRMIRDEDIRLRRAAGGIKGGNPALLRARAAALEVPSKVKVDDNLPPTPSSASASSSSSAKNLKTPNGVSSGSLFGEEGSRIDWTAVINRWNKIAKAHDRPKLSSLNETRRKHYRARLKATPNFWEVLELEIPRLGEHARSAKNYCTFPWLISSQEKLDKLAEGNYRDDDRPSPGGKPNEDQWPWNQKRASDG